MILWELIALVNIGHDSYGTRIMFHNYFHITTQIWTSRLNHFDSQQLIEIVSPSEWQRDRDYIAKRSQYQERGITEYWVVNPQMKPFWF